MTLHMSQRPPLGFVVEGKGEWATYPSLVARIVGAAVHAPCAKADGFGDILANIHEHLDDLVRAYRPLRVIVTIDLDDVLKSGECATCAHLKKRLEVAIAAWYSTRIGATGFQPLPEEVCVVVQVRLFESWWISDPRGLRRCHHFDLQHDNCDWTNVDEQVAPIDWLKARTVRQIDLKSPQVARDVIAKLDPAAMRQLSPSFDKFYREVLRGYGDWLSRFVGADREEAHGDES